MNDKIALSYHDSLIYESDVVLLKGKNWINDSLIAFWFEYLHHEVFKFRTEFLYVGPEVTQLLKMGDPTELPLILDPLKTHERKWIFFPVNDNTSVVSSGGSHWSLLVYCRLNSKWYHYDSQKGSNRQDALSLVHRISYYLDRSKSLSVIEAQCTQQNNSYDCGAFVMIYAQKLAEMAVSGMDLSSCFIQRQDATDIRDSLFILINSLKA